MLQVEKRRGRRELLRKDQMLERDWQTRFRVQPSIRDDGYVVVGRDGLEHRDRESDVVLVFCVALPEDKGIMEEDDLAIHVLDQDPEGLGASMNLLVPSEVGNDS